MKLNNCLLVSDCLSGDELPAGVKAVGKTLARHLKVSNLCLPPAPQGYLHMLLRSCLLCQANIWSVFPGVIFDSSAGVIEPCKEFGRVQQSANKVATEWQQGAAANLSVSAAP